MGAGTRKQELRRRRKKKKSLDKLRKTYQETRSYTKKEKIIEKVKKISPLLSKEAFLLTKLPEKEKE